MRRFRPVLWLLLPALLCRALVPEGFMPVATADTAAPLQLCPGHAGPGASAGHEPSVLLDGLIGGPDPADAPPAEDDHRSTPCAFAVAGVLGAAPAPLAAVPVDRVAVEAVAWRPAPRRVQPAVERAQAARAPPLHA